MRNSSCAASCSTSCPAAFSASALSVSWPIAGVPLSFPYVSGYSRTIPRRTHPQPPLPHPPSPPVSDVQNVPLPCSSSKDSLYFLLGNSTPGVRPLTLLNQPHMPLFMTRACAPRVILSPLAAIHLNPPLTFLNLPHLIAALHLARLLPIPLTTSPRPPARRTNRESPLQNP